jgi:hypothetical protein
MKTCEERNINPPFLTSALDGDEWLVSRPGRFIPGEKPAVPTVRADMESVARGKSLAGRDIKVGIMTGQGLDGWASVPVDRSMILKWILNNRGGRV